MKLHPASRREVFHIAVGTLICDGILIGTLFLLSRFGIGIFSFGRILLGAVCGSAAAVLNFAILCLTVQQAVETESEQERMGRLQLSYHLRLAMQAVWVLACFRIPQIPFIAGAVPILFPGVVIFFLKKTVRPGEGTGTAVFLEEKHPDCFEEQANLETQEVIAPYGSIHQRRTDPGNL